MPARSPIIMYAFACSSCRTNGLTFSTSKKAAEQAIKDEGWTQDQGKHWLCPVCQSRQRKVV